MSREGMAFDEPVLNRRKGKLVNTSQFMSGNKRWFHCVCDCGNTRDVLARVYNANNVTACEECVRKGDKPILDEYAPRANVTLEPDTLALLGLDLEIKGNATGKLMRQLLAEWGATVELASKDLPLTAKEWDTLRAAVLAKPALLHTNSSPLGKLLVLVRSGTAPNTEQVASKLLSLNAAQVLAVLSAVRWVRDHPDASDWWVPEERVNG